MVNNSKRGRGRPRKFDENEALDAAVKLFWTKGFDATTVDELAVAMGIGRPSMYGAFGDKEAIFMRALDRYLTTVAALPSGPLSSPKIQEAIQGYLAAVLEYATRHPDHQGCLIGSVAAVVDNPKIRHYVATSIGLSGDLVAQRLQAAVDQGELSKEFPVTQRARRAVNAMIALASRARHGAPLSDLEADVADGAAAVLQPS